MAKITLQDIAHSYDAPNAERRTFALKPLNLVWENGGAYALLGPSGCGKTTLLNIISGLVTPSQGRLLFDDKEVGSLNTEQRNIAQVFQFPVIYDTMTVAENLAFPLINRKVAESEILSRVNESLEMLGLQRLAHTKARGLTADTKQKISLGRGLVRRDVNAILFDEPLTVIDPHLKWQLRTQLKQIHQQFGHTMIYVTHDQTEALTFADKVVVMHEGSIVQVGSPEELFKRPTHTFVGKFIGSPGMNFIPCRVMGNTAFIGNFAVDVHHEYPVLEDDVLLGIRPEFVILHNSGDGIPATIQSVDDIGRHKIVTLQMGESTIDAIVPEGRPLPENPRVSFSPAEISIYQNQYLVEAKKVD